MVTEDYYNSTFYGEPVATADFARYEARAAAIINSITRNGYQSRLDWLTSKGYLTVAAALTTAYKNAICAQIEYFALYGINIASAGRQSAGFTVGKVSVSDGGRLPLGKASTVCPSAISELEQTGLLNPQVDTYDPVRAPRWMGV